MSLVRTLCRYILPGGVLLIMPFIAACDNKPEVTWSGGDLRGVNHTNLGIARFSVNNSSGPNILPFGEGGGACCISLPDKWQAELKAHIEWDVYTNPDLTKEFPGYQDDDKYNAWEKKLKKSIVKHSTTVDIPEYGEDRCGLTVHFLTCNEVKVTTSCWTYGAEKYPIKDQREMKEPQICPK
ncbi:DUF3304 domain-containing protein [Yersinia mollaretii]|uniref:DUF3304 domain-containing protein n=1 Tax=Yersinia mollaretii TaxID=33060 RepID=UPI0021BD815F|nr:DUF3304 domain-containing protein [Yersinia mollaretii]